MESINSDSTVLGHIVKPTKQFSRWCFSGNRKIHSVYALHSKVMVPRSVGTSFILVFLPMNSNICSSTCCETTHGVT